MHVGDLVKFPDWGIGIVLAVTTQPMLWNECADVFFFNAQQKVTVRKFKLEIVSRA
jgi:hypothetical protein